LRDAFTPPASPFTRVPSSLMKSPGLRQERRPRRHHPLLEGESSETDAQPMHMDDEHT
jgi:hypothetical protein